MANSKPQSTEDKKPDAANTNKYNVRRWSLPSKRAKGYAEDRKAKVHTYGPKEGKPLTDFEAGMRSGYLQCQSDHAGLFRYKQAMEATNDKKYAKKFSREKGTKLKEKGGNK